ncbi:hypothetical protein V1477_009911 [Vespula maculifrons]|uniref:Uncharacterized protein n=1 Tax=Vespula maculifrons TaxID=7453 RepID=A0ABD2CB56_VESMC
MSPLFMSQLQSRIQVLIAGAWCAMYYNAIRLINMFSMKYKQGGEYALYSNDNGLKYSGLQI